MSILAAATPSLLRTFDPSAILALNLAGTFVFGLSGALAGPGWMRSGCSCWRSWSGSPAGSSGTC